MSVHESRSQNGERQPRELKSAADLDRLDFNSVPPPRGRVALDVAFSGPSVK